MQSSRVAIALRLQNKFALIKWNYPFMLLKIVNILHIYVYEQQQTEQNYAVIKTICVFSVKNGYDWRRIGGRVDRSRGMIIFKFLFNFAHFWTVHKLNLILHYLIWISFAFYCLIIYSIELSRVDTENCGNFMFMRGRKASSHNVWLIF